MKQLCIIAACAVVPGREHALKKVINSLENQNVVPDKIVISASLKYNRFPEKTLNLNSISTNLTQINYCIDEGPGTKLLCALNTTVPNCRKSIFVLFDDDRIYNPWTLETMKKCVKYKKSCSHFTLKLKNGMVMGQAADMFGMEIAHKENVRKYFECIRNASFELINHDDLWISAYLTYVEHKPVVRSTYAKPYVPIRDSDVVKVGLNSWNRQKYVRQMSDIALKNGLYENCSKKLT